MNFFKAFLIAAFSVFLMFSVACSGPSEKEVQAKVDNGNAQLAEMRTLESEMIDSGVYSYDVEDNIKTMSLEKLKENKTKLEKYISLGNAVISIFDTEGVEYPDKDKKLVRDKVAFAEKTLKTLNKKIATAEKKAKPKSE